MSKPNRPYNFSAGPAILPPVVFERAAAAIRSLGGSDDAPLEEQLSILEISHRSATYDAIHEAAIDLCHEVIGIPRTCKVLFLQGGASLQFAMVPLNLRHGDKPAAYIDTGEWSKKAIQESKLLGATEVISSSAASGYDHIPTVVDVERYRDASYVHITTNNTIFGTEWSEIPQLQTDVPLIADLSSNIGSRPMALERIALGYAGAQKNLGPSGLTVVFIREDLLAREPASPVPTMLRYSTHAEANSLFNTPNTFGVLVLKLVLEWVREQGGVEAIGERNRRKADKLYECIDNSRIYRAHAQPGSRSLMNITWTLGDLGDPKTRERTSRFLAAAEGEGMSGLKGHRSVGGCRASIYNAFPETGVDALLEFMQRFERDLNERSR